MKERRSVKPAVCIFASVLKRGEGACGRPSHVMEELVDARRFEFAILSDQGSGFHRNWAPRRGRISKNPRIPEK
jgi:hypothetical protein